MNRTTRFGALLKMNREFRENIGLHAFGPEARAQLDSYLITIGTVHEASRGYRVEVILTGRQLETRQGPFGKYSVPTQVSMSRQVTVAPNGNALARPRNWNTL